MRALVVFESMFGNNRAIAEAIAAGLGEHLEVEVVEVGAAPTRLTDEVQLVVVGGPNHQFGLSRPGSREMAGAEAAGPLVSAGAGLREWLEVVSADPASTCVAVFDTRMDNRVLRRVDRAARTVTRHLRRLGLRPIADSESFRVLDMKGPLADGELERARRWGVRLASLLLAAPAA